MDKGTNEKMHYLYGFVILLWLNGCGTPEPKVVNNQYTLEECKEELLNAEDYSQGERIDKIVVIKKVAASVFDQESLNKPLTIFFDGRCPICTKELETLKGVADDLYKVVPGIRPKGFAKDDQARVVTPGEAVSLGANAIVVGRPIYKSEQPRKVVESILEEIN